MLYSIYSRVCLVYLANYVLNKYFFLLCMQSPAITFQHAAVSAQFIPEAGVLKKLSLAAFI
jgi:hypothetical protein